MGGSCRAFDGHPTTGDPTLPFFGRAALTEVLPILWAPALPLLSLPNTRAQHCSCRSLGFSDRKAKKGDCDKPNHVLLPACPWDWTPRTQRRDRERAGPRFSRSLGNGRGNSGRVSISRKH